MKTQRKVTEKDFRKDEYKDAEIEDYEFREDGKLVRKDRWETGIRRIATTLGIRGEFEIDDVLQKIDELQQGCQK